MSSPGLDAFELLKQIGKGSYGEVTLARHRRDRKQYVIKRIALRKASKRERHSAEQEAKLLSRLKHPNIVSYKDSFEVEGILHIAMQYCEGGDLYTKLKELKGQPLEERQIVEWFVQIAMALQYMHERNILHRDLKTQNIFLTKSKIIKVGDLGIARVLDNSNDMATTLIGTPYYMSPELFSNKPYNYKSDVWALGCCVYEMATLKHAFNAKDMNSLVYKILKGKMPIMPKSYSQELLQLIKSMLHQNADCRPSVNRILRDPYIKKNISIFLEETKRSRPLSGSRPSSASRARQAISSRSGDSSSSSSARSHLPPHGPPSAASSSASAAPVSSNAPSVSQDATDSRPVKKDYVVHMEAPHIRPQPLPPAEPEPVPVVISHRRHSRKPSDGAKQDLPPISEDKQLAGNNQPDNESIKSKSEASSDSNEDTMKAKSLEEEKIPTPEIDINSPKRQNKKKQSWLSRKSDDSKPSNKITDIFKNSDYGASPAFIPSPKPVDKPRPLPPPPKVEESEGLPQHRNGNIVDSFPRNPESKSSSTSSSREDNQSWDSSETPRSMPNLSARARRREQTSASQSSERPMSARKVRLKRPESERISRVERNKMEPVRLKPKVQRVRQPSLKDESSSSDESTLKENEDFKKDKEKQRENKEMNNFITLLDTTLHLNKEDDKSDQEDVKKDEPDGLLPIPEKKEPAKTVHRSSSLPTVETLCSASRLTQRIQVLHADCVTGVGFEKLHKAFDILNNIEDDEVEPQLVKLLGKDGFDQYAGKIWQLKFCNECFESLPQLDS